MLRCCRGRCSSGSPKPEVRSRSLPLPFLKPEAFRLTPFAGAGMRLRRRRLRESLPLFLAAIQTSRTAAQKQKQRSAPSLRSKGTFPHRESMRYSVNDFIRFSSSVKVRNVFKIMPMTGDKHGSFVAACGAPFDVTQGRELVERRASRLQALGIVRICPRAKSRGTTIAPCN